MVAETFKKGIIMSENVANLIKAFVLLSDTDKHQVFDLVKRIETGTQNEKRAVFESFGLDSARSTTINFAPTPGACPTCGK